MLFTFVVVMAGIVLLMMTVDNRRQPSRRGRNTEHGSFWADGGGMSHSWLETRVDRTERWAPAA